MTEENWQCRPSGFGPLLVTWAQRFGLLAVPFDGYLLERETGHNLRCSCWCSNGCILPVLKHRPRSATCVRVFGCQPSGTMKVKAGSSLLRRESILETHRRPIPGHAVADLSENVSVATRKMVNYA